MIFLLIISSNLLYKSIKCRLSSSIFLGYILNRKREGGEVGPGIFVISGESGIKSGCTWSHCLYFCSLSVRERSSITFFIAVLFTSASLYRCHDNPMSNTCPVYLQRKGLLILYHLFYNKTMSLICTPYPYS